MVEIHSPSDNLDAAQNGGKMSTKDLESQVQAFKKTVATHMDPKRMYKESESKGRFWGPKFALMKELNITELKATVTIIIENIAECMPRGFTQPHIIHPTTLDAFIHSSLMIFGHSCGRGLMFPVGVRNLTISADLVTHPGEEITFLTTIDLHDSSSTAMEVMAFQKRSDAESQLCVQLGNGELRGTVDPHALLGGPYATRDPCYQINWDVDLDQSTPPKVQMPTTITSKDIAGQEERLKSLNRAATYFVISCLSQVQVTNLQRRHLAYYDWMLLLREFEHHQNWYHQIAQEEIQEHLHHLKTLGVEGEAVSRIGSNLTAILSGDSDPLSLLLEDGLLSRLYAEDLAAQECYFCLIDYVKSLVFKNPQIRVLEIGTGTADLTVPLLRSLGREENLPLKQYDFTDVASGFFDEARQKLQEWERFLCYKTLDISIDPIQQCFTSRSYDLVLAYNALHVTANVDDAIANTRKLLKPGHLN